MRRRREVRPEVHSLLAECDDPEEFLDTRAHTRARTPATEAGSDLPENI